MAKKASYTPMSKAAKTFVPGRTFQPASTMKPNTQQPKSAPRSKSR
jgi:hypothetical protein